MNRNVTILSFALFSIGLLLTTTNSTFAQTITVTPLVAGHETKAIALIPPIYPDAAKAARVAGLVKVEITADEKGVVITAKVVSGEPLLHEAALDAARQSRFAPLVIAGQPAKFTAIITYTFTPTFQMPVVAGLSGPDLLRRAVNLPKPDYPEAARQAKVAGTVSVRVTIDEFGAVTEAMATDGPALLRENAVAAAQQAKFAPFVLKPLR